MLMKLLNTRYIIPILTTILGCVWVFLGVTEYGVWSAKGPSGGFFPVFVGGLLMLASFFALIQAKNTKETKYKLISLLPLGACIAIVLISQVFGMLTCILVYLITWLRWFEKYKWKSTLIISGVTMLLIYGVFVKWLQVPFTQGLLLKMFM